MVPAALPAIRSLRATRIQVKDINNVQQCLVCQEDYCNGEKVTCMPCFHMFHTDCITKWLVMCHLCPVCKFQMPKYSWLAMLRRYSSKSVFRIVIYFEVEEQILFKLHNLMSCKLLDNRISCKYNICSYALLISMFKRSRFENASKLSIVD